jgi:hypothetical protein
MWVTSALVGVVFGTGPCQPPRIGDGQSTRKQTHRGGQRSLLDAGDLTRKDIWLDFGAFDHQGL